MEIFPVNLPELPGKPHRTIEELNRTMGSATVSQFKQHLPGMVFTIPVAGDTRHGLRALYKNFSNHQKN